MEQKPMPAFSLEGHTLGKYRILQPLGQGGMARVYRAYHPQLNRYVAVKVLRTDLPGQEELLTRFRREAQAIAALRHPHIIQVFDFDVEDGLYYMVMELVEGDTLKARMNDYRTRGERLPLAEVLRILLDVLDGLAYAHEVGVIHRDLKPANILLTRDGQAVLSDFGIAQIVGGTQHTATGILMGTLHYMAPEQGAERGDQRSDIYSLGVLFYEMLIGKPPFDADTPLAILMKHMNDPLPLPSASRPEIPASLEAVIFRALAKNPAERFAAAADMSAALMRAAAEADIDIPGRISPAFSFSTTEAPEEPVAVFSGDEREMVPHPEDASDRTDSTLGERLHPGSPPESPTAGMSRAHRILWILLAEGVLLFGFLAFAINNLIITGNPIVLEKGWPVFILLPAIFLCMLLEVIPQPALFIPVPLLAWVGLLCGFYALSGRWDIWTPWLCTPLALLAGLGIALSEWSAAAGKKSGKYRTIARVLLVILFALFCLTAVILAFFAMFPTR
jgi:serine/threonine protein kinase